MNKDLLEDFRNDYSERLVERDKKEKVLDSLMQRKEILENSRVVQDYIELLEQIRIVRESFDSAEQVFLHTLYDYEKKGLVDETNSIYLYDGTYMTRNNTIIRTDRNSPDAEFDRYIDIESTEEVEMPVEDRRLFEMFNKVIILDESLPTKHSLYEVHNQFMHDAVTEGEEVACNKVLTRNKKNL